MIIGAMKCGTSSLYDYLIDHPAIAACIRKEPEFFSENQGHKFPVDDYWDLWPDFDPAVHTYVLEASTGYTKYPAEPNVVANVAAAGLAPKFIYVVRNPIQRIESHYHHMNTANSTWRNTLLGPGMIEVSNYFLQLQRWQEKFPRDDFLVLDFADLAADPRAVVGRACAFLGLSDPPERESYDVQNRAQSRRSLTTVLRRHNMNRTLRAIPQPVMDAANELVHRVRPLKKKRLSTAQRDQVFTALAPDMKRLSEEYGIDVSRWGF
ncbi:MAG: sulfotransferase domain-containing protein [Hyphomicrobiales bacterium]|nr:sulfotransferase domain-containing protein [Hyphomicrobiales bacterium]